MGDLADDFNYIKEQKRLERMAKEPGRAEYATKLLTDAGYVTRYDEGEKTIIVNGYIRFWPYTGWYSGKGIGQGRGIHNFIKALANKD